MKHLKQIISIAIIAVFVLLLIPRNAVFAEEPISIGVNVSNKLDVALSVGPTTVDYSKFEESLRAKLAEKSPAVLEEDLYITAAKSVSANTTSEFNWWVYDHTYLATGRPSRTDADHTSNLFNSAASYPTYFEYYNYLKSQALLGASKQWNSTAAPSVAELEYFKDFTEPKKVSDADHIYIESDGSSAQTGSGSAANNQDKTSPQYNTTNHPYAGKVYHMEESDNGAKMDFFGYGAYSYIDFRYLPNDQKTKKVFEFAIQEFEAYDALEGVGFLFNSQITGSYEAKTQVVSGYLLLLKYNSSGTGMCMSLYKLNNVNTYNMHHGSASTSAGSNLIDSQKTAATLTVAGGTTISGMTKIAHTTVYDPAHKFRRIKLEVNPSNVKVWYNGSTSDSSVLTTSIAANASPVNWSTNTNAEEGQKSASNIQEIKLDSNVIKGYGFGTLGSYDGHGCARPTHVALQNLSMVVDKVRSLTEVVREPEWHENTYKFLVNLNEEPIEDFSSISITSELLNRLKNDDIYYIGWCSDVNAGPSQDFLTKNDLKGAVVNIDDSVTSTYDSQVQAIADEIYKRYWRENDDDTVLISDNVILNISGAPKTNTVDPEWPNGKWRVLHSVDGFDNNDGLYPLSGQYVSDLDLQFNKPGSYSIYYGNQFIKTMIAHRSPVANIRVELSGNVPAFSDDSYDPDDLANGIVSSEWSYLNVDKDTSPITRLTLEQLHANLPSLIPGDTYLISLTVKDKLGATATIARQIRYILDMDPGEISAPFADFEIAPQSILKNVGGQKISITNKSYDLQGLAITSSFTLTKGGIPVSFTFTGSNGNEIDTSAMVAGDYVMTLVVNNGYYDSEAITRSFSIINDTSAPTASAVPPTGSFSINTPVTVTFSDLGGSQFKEQRIIITYNTGDPSPSDVHWTSQSASSTRTVTINNVGITYIHWEAFDYAGNKGSGYFGPYTLTKQDPELSITANPAGSVTYPSPVTLTATFETLSEPSPSGTVYFYLDTALIGSAAIANDKAEITYSHSLTPPPTGSCTFSASYLGDTNYNSYTDSLSYTITKNSTASVTVGSQTNKTYDGDPFEPVGISVVGTAMYETRYTGRDGTTYNSTTPPTNAGQYTLTVKTTHPGYVEASDSADFEIYKKEITLALTANPSSQANAMSNVGLTATVTGAIDIPAGKIRFSHGTAPTQIGSNTSIVYDTGYTASATWASVPAGVYSLKAEYIAGSTDNYTATNNGTITVYTVSKRDQTGFKFTTSNPLEKIYGDQKFFLPTGGGQTSSAPSFAVTSGSDVVSVDPATGEATILKTGTAVITATKPGDNAYNPAIATLTINVSGNPNVSVVIASQISRAYDAAPYQVYGISVTGSLYKVEYTGRDGTSYNLSENAPVNAGKYTVIVTTTDPNADEVTASADFEILKRELTLILTATQYSPDIKLHAALQNAVDLPAGTIKFSVNNNLLNNSAIVYSNSAYGAEYLWENVAADIYNIKAEYTEVANDNYTVVEAAVLHGYSSDKLDQTSFGFSSASINKTYGDTAFNVTAGGGNPSLTITYTVTSGEDVISVNSSTGEVTILKAGSAIITASNPGDNDYNPAFATITVNVGKKAAALSITMNDFKCGETAYPSVTVNESRGAVTYTYVGQGGTQYTESQILPSSVGSYTVKAVSQEALNYLSGTAACNFEIKECDCIINNILFNGGTIEIDYYKLEKALKLSSNVNFTACGNHGDGFNIAYSLVGAPAGAVISGVHPNAEISVNNSAAGNTVSVKVTVTHIATGKKSDKTVHFTVVKGQPEDTSSAPYNKNSNNNLTVDITSFNDPIANITCNGIVLVEHTDYEISGGQLVLKKDFLDTLPPGEIQLDISFGAGEPQTFYINIDFGHTNINVQTDPSLPAITTPTDLKALLLNSNDQQILADGYDINIDLVVSKVKKTSDVDLINKNKGSDKTAALFMDIALIKTVSGKDPEYITSFSKNLVVVIDLPSEFRGHSKYWAARVHQSQLTMLSASVTNNGTKLQFETDRLSTVGILYKNGSNGGNVSTGDSSNMILWIVLMTVSVCAIIFLIWKKKKCNN